MRRLLPPILAALALTLGACHKESSQQTAAKNARAIASVEAAQNANPPIVPITLQPIGGLEMVQKNLIGPGCNFAPDGSIGAVVLAQQHRAFVKVDDNVVELAADPGSAPTINAFPRKFTGKAFVLTLTHTGPEPGKNSPATVTVTDPNGRTIYTAAGIVQCS